MTPAQEVELSILLIHLQAIKEVDSERLQKENISKDTKDLLIGQNAIIIARVKNAREFIK